MVIVEFNKTTNKELGLVVTDIGQRKRAKEHVEIIEIEGRSGSIVDRQGTFSSYRRDVTFVNLKRDMAAPIHKWLSGRGILRTSIDEGGFFYADTIDDLTREYIGEDKSYISVSFLVEPFFYLESGNQVMNLTSPVTLQNIGNVYADPIIKLFGTGSGSLMINEQVITLTGIQDHLTIDSRLKVTHKDGLPAGRKMTGPYPTLIEGKNIIGWTGAITRVELIPGWREI